MSDRELPLSIYLALEQGEHADLRVVSEASIELIKAMQDVMGFIDPTSDVKVVIQNGKENCLRLNSFIKLIGPKRDTDEDSKEYWRGVGVGVIFAGVLSWVPGEIGSHYLGKALDLLDAKVLELFEAGATEEEVQELREECTKILEGLGSNTVGSEHISKFYKVVEADRAILGVGMTSDHEAAPAYLVPRDEFAARAKGKSVQTDPQTRERIERVDLVLVQPRLTSDKKSWRFASNGIEFAAKVLDDEFLAETLSGKRSLPLIEGLVLDADMVISEVKSGEVWMIQNRAVKKVYEVRPVATQDRFLL